MPGPTSHEGPGSPREPDWKRKQRLAEIFGDTMPETTSDERDERDAGDRAGGAGGSSESTGDRWLREQVPPHHGGQ